MEPWKRSFLVVYGLLEFLAFSGCLFGWPSLVLMLQEEGVYLNYCQINNSRHNIDNRTDNGTHLLSALVPLETSLIELNEEPSFSNEVLEESQSSTNPEIPNFGLNERENCTSTNNDTQVKCASNPNPKTQTAELEVLGCDEQRVQMTNVYTFAAIAFGLTAILIGFSLEIWGLRVTRLTGSTFLTAGFLFLTYTTSETSYFLWPGLNLVALGSNQLRLSSFQLAELYPKYRATILQSYSSAYALSTTLFILIQLIYEAGIPWRSLFLFCTGLSCVTFIPTFFMPRMKIIAKEEDSNLAEETNPKSKTILVSNNFNPKGQSRPIDVEDESTKNLMANGNGDEINLPPLDVKPLGSSNMHDKATQTKLSCFGNKRQRGCMKSRFMASVFSLSGILHIYWQFINLFLILFYSATFNIWASKVTSDIHKVSFYIKMSGICCFVVPICTPTIGYLTDKMVGRAKKRPTPVERLAYTMQAPTFAMAFATLVLSLTMVCKLFLTETAIYISLIFIAVSRPAVIGSCTAYVRCRFPADQFNVLNGVFTTVISTLCFVQYPIMDWMTSSSEAYLHAHWLLLIVLLGSFLSPLHLMFRNNIMRYAKRQIDEQSE